MVQELLQVLDKYNILLAVMLNLNLFNLKLIVTVHILFKQYNNVSELHNHLKSLYLISKFMVKIF